MSFDLTYAKTYCEYRGLEWNDEIYNHTLPDIKEAQLTQVQFNHIIKAHIDSVAILMNPKSYGFIGRILMAFYFLTGIGQRIK